MAKNQNHEQNAAPVSMPEGNLTFTVTDAKGQTVAVLIATPKRFSTGSVGYNAASRTHANGAPIQLSINGVVIGSKPKGR